MVNTSLDSRPTVSSEILSITGGYSTYDYVITIICIAPEVFGDIASSNSMNLT